MKKIDLVIFAVLIACAALTMDTISSLSETDKEPEIENQVVMPETEYNQLTDEELFEFAASENLVQAAPVMHYSTFYRLDIPMDEITQAELCYAAERANIDPLLACAIIWKETGFRNATGDSGNSIGYMQVQPRWHYDRMARLNCTDLMIPSENFLVGCDYIGELLQKYSLESALTYYNSGRPGYNQYAKDVITKYQEYQNNGNIRCVRAAVYQKDGSATTFEDETGNLWNVDCIPINESRSILLWISDNNTSSDVNDDWIYKVWTEAHEEF